MAKSVSYQPSTNINPLASGLRADEESWVDMGCDIDFAIYYSLFISKFVDKMLIKYCRRLCPQ